jgi:hypothetical protein
MVPMDTRGACGVLLVATLMFYGFTAAAADVRNDGEWLATALWHASNLGLVKY